MGFVDASRVHTAHCPESTGGASVPVGHARVASLPQRDGALRARSFFGLVRSAVFDRIGDRPGEEAFRPGGITSCSFVGTTSGTSWLNVHDRPHARGHRQGSLAGPTDLHMLGLSGPTKTWTRSQVLCGPRSGRVHRADDLALTARSRHGLLLG